MKSRIKPRRASARRYAQSWTMSAVAVVMAFPALAQDATWSLNPGSGDFNTAANWLPATVPTGTAFFGTSNTTALSFSLNTTVGGFTLNPGASNYTFTTSSPTLTFGGAGIVVNGGSVAITNDVVGLLLFQNSSTAGNAVLTLEDSSITIFRNTSTAGNATITIRDLAGLTFADNSTAGNAAITNNRGLEFRFSSSAGNAVITNNGSQFFVASATAGNAAITNNNLLFFGGLSTAGNATITNNLNMLFSISSTAGNSTIINNGVLDFISDSRAGGATIITNSGGRTSFLDLTSGEQGRFITNAGGAVDISAITPGTGTTAGSIEGAGSYFLGSKNFAVGSNNLSTTVSGVIADGGTAGGVGGSLDKVGTGTLTLTGVNTYTGGTTVNGGTLQLGNGGTTGSIVGAVTVNAGATLAVNRSDNLTLTNAVSGAGGFAQNGTGTTTFNQAFAYTGGTTVNAGVLQMAGAGTLGASSGATRVNTGATLDLDGTAQTQNGGVTLAGGTIRNGTLNSSGTFTSLGGAMGAVLGGTGSFVQTSGTTNLTATNTYTGATTVNGGTLAVNGSIASSSATTVNAGGTLSGTGALGNVTVNGGTLAPGNSIGTVTVNGNLVFTAASTYLIEIDPASSDRTNVTGTATLGGAQVSAIYANGSYVARSYTILNAQGGVTGTFASLVNTNLPASFTPTLRYDANNAYLDLALNFAPTGFTPINQTNVANALINSFNAAGGIPLVFGALRAQNLTQISGEHATGTQQTTFDAMDRFVNVLTDPFVGTRAGGAPRMGAASYADNDQSLAYAAKRKRTGAERDAYAAFKAPPKAVPFERRWSVWGAGYGGTQQTDGDAGTGSQKFTNHVYGGAAGFDYRLTPETLVGFALGGAGTSFGLANGLGGGRSEVFQAGLYGRHTSGPAYISGALAWGWQDITTNRTVFANSYRANFDANAITGRLEGGWRFAYGASGITPYAAGQVTSFFLPGYAETLVAGVNTFALAYADKDVTASRTELGLRGDTSFTAADAIVTLRGRAAWAHNFNTDRSISAIFQTLPVSGFTVFGASPAQNSALVSAGAEAKWLKGFSVAATFEGEFSSRTDSYAGKAVVRYQW
jgi:autotransporter-associated beta strand protein